MRHNRVIICKPGCNLQPKPNKTNLQLREMQCLQTAMQDGGIKAELMTIPQVLDIGIDLNDCAIVIFNSAKCFDTELFKLLELCSVLDTIDITLISNDCRLNFNTTEIEQVEVVDRLIRHMMDGDVKLRILTNATKHLDSYIDRVCNWHLASTIPIYSSRLYTLPAFKDMQSEILERDIDVLYACMHYKDYSDYRQQQIIALSDYFGKGLQLIGDLDESPAFIAAQSMIEGCYNLQRFCELHYRAKTIPVILEPEYAYYEVLPNRIAEALMCRCVPVVNAKWQVSYDFPAEIVTDSSMFEHCIESYVNQYDSITVQKRLDVLQSFLGMHKTELVVQLQNIFKNFINLNDNDTKY